MRRHLADYYAAVGNFDFELGRILHVAEGLRLHPRQDRRRLLQRPGTGGGRPARADGQAEPVRAQRPRAVRRPRPRHPSRAPRALTYTPDLHPTLCELAGVPVAPTVETSSLVPLLRAGDAAEARPLARPFVCQVYKDVQRMVTDGRWKADPLLPLRRAARHRQRRPATVRPAAGPLGS